MPRERASEKPTEEPDERPGEGWAPTPAGTPPRQVTPLEIQQKEFAVARFGGYKMRDVDEFLDELTESVGTLVAENERLRRQAGASPMVGSPDLDDVARQADEIIQRARDEARRIVAEANERAAGIAGSLATGEGGDVEAVQAFLAQERAFLQSLAGLVQGHVESVKGMARTAPKRTSSLVPSEGGTSGTDTGSDPAKQDAEAGAPPVDTDAPPVPDADATQVVPEPDEPVRVEEPQRTPAKAAKRDDGEDSLRELFWGEED